MGSRVFSEERNKCRNYSILIDHSTALQSTYGKVPAVEGVDDKGLVAQVDDPGHPVTGLQGLLQPESKDSKEKLPERY